MQTARYQPWLCHFLKDIVMVAGERKRSYGETGNQGPGAELRSQEVEEWEPRSFVTAFLGELSRLPRVLLNSCDVSALETLLPCTELHPEPLVFPTIFQCSHSGDQVPAC